MKQILNIQCILFRRKFKIRIFLYLLALPKVTKILMQSAEHFVSGFLLLLVVLVKVTKILMQSAEHFVASGSYLL